MARPQVLIMILCWLGVNSNETKIISSPLHRVVAVMASGPSPTFSWRFKVLLYVTIVVVFILPFDIFYLPSRYFLLRTLWKIALPLQAISFPDFFLADILTSVAKFYFRVLGSNLVLRCLPDCICSHCLGDASAVPCIFFLVENEWNKIANSTFELPDDEVPREEENLLALGSTNH